MLRMFFASLMGFVCASVQAVANTTIVGMAHDKQLNFQPAASPVMELLTGLHNILLVIIFGVSLLVLAVTIYIIVRFNRKANPVPSTTTHNLKLEAIWTTIPILILIVIGWVALPIHYKMEEVPEAAMTIKVTGYQWYWGYQYPDQGGFSFDSYMLKDEDAAARGEPRLLAVDNRVVVPVNTPVRIQLTGADVIHSWAVPAFGVKRDAVPGRLNETWFEATKEGVFYGQCSELCGVKHGFMPIAVEVVSKEKFDAWVAEKQKAAGITPPAAAAPAPTETKI